MHGTNTSHMTEAKGTVDRLLPNPHGDAWVLLLTDGTEVQFPPHLSTQLSAAVRSGGEVTVRGIRSRGADRLAAVSLETADRTRINAQVQRRAPLFRQR